MTSRLSEVSGVVRIEETPSYVIDRLSLGTGETRSILANTRSPEALIVLEGALEVQKEGGRYSFGAGEVYELPVDGQVTLTAKRNSQLIHIYAHDALVKFHNGDFMLPQDRKQLPALGIYAVNVAPELAMTQTRALLDLADEEVRLLGLRVDSKEMRPSNFRAVLTEAILKGDRWKKWVPYTEGWDEASVRSDSGRLKQVVEFSGHYAYGEPAVVEAVRQLETNIKVLTGNERWLSIRDAIKAAIIGWYEDLATPRVKAADAAGLEELGWFYDHHRETFELLWSSRGPGEAIVPTDYFEELPVLMRQAGFQEGKLWWIPKGPVVPEDLQERPRLKVFIQPGQDAIRAQLRFPENLWMKEVDNLAVKGALLIGDADFRKGVESQLAGLEQSFLQIGPGSAGQVNADLLAQLLTHNLLQAGRIFHAGLEEFIGEGFQVEEGTAIAA